LVDSIEQITVNYCSLLLSDCLFTIYRFVETRSMNFNCIVRIFVLEKKNTMGRRKLNDSKSSKPVRGPGRKAKKQGEPTFPKELLQKGSEKKNDFLLIKITIQF